MAKRFDIHEWQAKQKLAEQEEFTPDLEDDDLKRAKIQQMMAKEKEPMGGDEKLRNAVETIADMYSYGEILDAIESFYIKNDEQKSAEIARKHAKEFRDMLDELDEANVTGGGAGGSTFNAGTGPQYATPMAFGDNKKKKRKAYMGYKEVNEQEEPEEKEYVKDVEKVSNLPALDRVNTKAEWEDMMQLAFDMADDITQVQDAHKRMWLQNTLKSLNKA